VQFIANCLADVVALPLPVNQASSGVDDRLQRSQLDGNAVEKVVAAVDTIGCPFAMLTFDSRLRFSRNAHNY